MWHLPPEDSKAADVWISSLEDDDTKLNLLSGAVRSTKTVGSLIAWADRVSSGPRNAPRMMVGNTERTLAKKLHRSPEGVCRCIQLPPQCRYR